MNIRRLRRDTGLTQVELAKRLGVSQPTLNRLESGRGDIKLSTVAQLCRALGCRPGDLFEGPLKLPPRRRS